MALSSFILGIFNTSWVVIIIALIAIIVIFGSKKIPEIARAFGRTSTEYHKAKIEAKREIEKIKNPGINSHRERLEQVADTLGIDYSDKTDDDLRNSIETEINRTTKK